MDFQIFTRFVGEAAYTGTHSWVFSNSFFTRESNSELVPDVRI